MTDRNAPCSERVEEEYTHTIKVLRHLFTAYQNGTEDEDDEWGTFWDYGLCFDYVAPGTFGDQDEGYFRYQLSWGGPSDEFRYYTNPDFSPHRVTYWFLDWFDGARRPVHGEDCQLMEDIFETFRDVGSVDQAYTTAMAGWTPPEPEPTCDECDECGDEIDSGDEDAGQYGIENRPLCGDCYRDIYD